MIENIRSLQPLDGVNVLDLSQMIAGPAAANILGEWGASVVKVERPGGDPSRRLGIKDADDSQDLIFDVLNYNKQCIVRDLSGTDGREWLEAYLETADIVIVGLRPEASEKLGLGVDRLWEIKEDLIYIRLTGYSDWWGDVSRRGVDSILQGESGLMSINGETSGRPMRVGVPVIDMCAALAIVNAALASILARERSGRGVYREISLIDSALFLQTIPMAEFLNYGRPPSRNGNASPFAAPSDSYTAKDGDMSISAYLPNQWETFCSLIDAEELLEDSRFSRNHLRVKYREELRILINEKLKKWTVEEWGDKFDRANIMWGRINGYQDMSEQIERAKRDGGPIRRVKFGNLDRWIVNVPGIG